MNLIRKLGLVVLALIAVSYIAGPVLAQDKTSDKERNEHELKKIEAQTKQRIGFSSPAWGAGLGAGLVIIGAGLGFGKIGAAALESMARQPQTAGQVQTAMIIIGALLEGATFFALIICIIIGGSA